MHLNETDACRQFLLEKIGMSKGLFAFPVGVLDPNLGEFPYMYVNDRMVQLTGYQPAEIVGRSFQILFGAKTDSETRLHARLGLQNGRYTETDLVCYRRNGKSFWNRMTFAPICDHMNRLSLILVSGQDITRIRRLEDGLLNPERLNQRTVRAMQIVVDKTEARFQAVRQFQSVLVSHLERGWMRHHCRAFGKPIGAELNDALSTEHLDFTRRGALMGTPFKPLRPDGYDKDALGA